MQDFLTCFDRYYVVTGGAVQARASPETPEAYTNPDLSRRVVTKSTSRAEMPRVQRLLLRKIVNELCSEDLQGLWPQNLGENESSFSRTIPRRAPKQRGTCVDEVPDDFHQERRNAETRSWLQLQRPYYRDRASPNLRGYSS